MAGKCTPTHKINRIHVDDLKRVLELEVAIASIQNKNAHWKSCQDGSYEMACSYDGISKLYDELEQLKAKQ